MPHCWGTTGLQMAPGLLSAFQPPPSLPNKVQSWQPWSTSPGRRCHKMSCEKSQTRKGKRPHCPQGHYSMAELQGWLCTGPGELCPQHLPSLQGSCFTDPSEDRGGISSPVTWWVFLFFVLSPVQSPELSSCFCKEK